MRCLIVACCVSWVGWGMLTGAVAQEQSADQSKEDVHKCTHNLKAVYAGIQEYRKQHKRLPNWLSDVVKAGYLEEDVLLCPVTKRTGEARLFGLKDPDAETSYIFEFCDAPVPGPDVVR